MSGKNRRFVFTNFDMSFSKTFWDNLIEDKKCSYVCYGIETCPTTGREHQQGYVIFKHPKSFKAAKSHMPPGCHIEVAKGGSTSNIKYCSKDGKFFEFGDKDHQGARTDLSEVMDYAREYGVDAVMDMYPAVWARNYRAIDIYVNRKRAKRTTPTELIYIWGPTKTNKTGQAHDAGGKIVQWQSPYLNGYEQQDVIIFDDVDHNFSMPRQMLLQLADRYPVPVNVKGGCMQFTTKTIYMTSNYPPEVTFPWMDDALRRRMKVIKTEKRPENTE